MPIWERVPKDMIERYRTVRRSGEKEIVIKKSRFIGHIMPVESEEDANAFIEDIRKKHWNATHNCFAYMIGERDEIQKQSDDGEPSGTAGKPILEVIKNQGLKNVAIVVTRYFGGIMLGAGGLIRAYTDGAVAAIEAGEAITRVLHRQIFVELDYTWLGKVENELRNREVRMGETRFTDKVTLECLPLDAEKDAFMSWMVDLTQGQSLITEGEQLYFIEGE
ncbi:YigZ family protein [Paenibacillus cookii]|uniref:YigZ family protein n=2 Tax=Paenibacillus cookii TaxID=157839 RepID=A0ABQ4M2L9_9BACL|nr:IMPACT family member YigZ [Paenibacillus sp. P1XP2]GIO69787.1 YigZ family protein [Paenibacillus cookii]